jgi:hypothetical protein
MRVRSLLASVALFATSWLVPTAAHAEHEDDDSAGDEERKDEETKAEDDDKSSEERSADDSRERGAKIGKGSLSLTMTTTLASYSQLTFVLQPPGSADMSGTITNVAWGPSVNPVTLEVGYALSSHALLGVYLELGGSTLTTEIQDLGINQELSSARFLLGPKFEFLFSDSGTLRPFVLGVAGFTWAPQQNTAESISLTGFQVLAGAGLHWHVSEGFSIDPALHAGGGTGWGTVNQGVYHNVPAHGSLVTAGLVLGATGWVL